MQHTIHADPAAVVTAAAVAQLVAALTAQHGPTLDIEAMAGLLGVTPSTLRSRRSRRGDIPDPIPCTSPTRWSVVAVAYWLAGVPAPDAAPSAAPAPRRRGRPRNRPRLVAGGEA